MLALRSTCLSNRAHILRYLIKNFHSQFALATASKVLKPLGENLSLCPVHPPFPLPAGYIRSSINMPIVDVGGGQRQGFAFNEFAVI